MRYLPRFHALRAFEATLRTGSLSAAARALNVTPGAVSRQISQLEAQVGAPLMRRHSRGITANDRGFRLFRRLSSAFSEIEDAVAEAAGTTVPEALTLSVYPTFAIQWLLPRLPRFHARAPEVDLRIRTTLVDARFDRDETDIAIRIGTGEWPGQTAWLLMRREFTPVASPRLVEAAGGDPEAALGASRILYSDLHVGHWRLWLDRAGIAGPRLDRGIRFDNSSLAYQGAREGAGFAIGQMALLAEDLRGRRLVAPFDLVIEGGRQYYLTCRRGESRRPGIRLFTEWILAEIAAGAPAAT